jgi:hypothetical protein
MDDTAARFGVEAGLVSAEAALRCAATSPDALRTALEGLGAVTGGQRARRMVEVAAVLSESAGESRSRWLFIVLGPPDPQQQAEIRDRHGVLVARVAFLFGERRVVVEFDGMAKYTDPAALPGREGAGGPAAGPGLRGGATDLGRPVGTGPGQAADPGCVRPVRHPA